MKKQEYAEVEARLYAAASELSDRAGKREAVAEELWNQPVEKVSEDAWFLEGTDRAVKHIPKRRIWSTMAAAAAVLVFVMFYYINLRTDAVVFLDVNPSVSLEINSREKVTQALACNEDGRKILDEMDLRATDVDVAVNALIGSMIRHGYLSEVQDTLLLSIDCTDKQKKDVLRQRLSGEIIDEMMALLGKSSVFEQDVDVDDDLEDLAEQYGITPGKAALIMKLIEKDPSLDFAKLSGMPMNTLSDYLRDSGINLRDYTWYLGDDPDDDDPDDRFDDADDRFDDADDFYDDADDLHDDYGGKDRIKTVTPNQNSAAAGNQKVTPSPVRKKTASAPESEPNVTRDDYDDDDSDDYYRDDDYDDDYDDDDSDDYYRDDDYGNDDYDDDYDDDDHDEDD